MNFRAVLIICSLLVPGEVFVDVGEHKLCAEVAGTEGPTVILESGLGDGLAVWRQVQDAAAKSCRVVAYDRAGLGRSEPGPDPRSSVQIAKELHELLVGLEVEPPYVLVGHSVGGFHIRTFAALYPDEVGALIYVDASHEDQERRFRELFPERWDLERARIDEYYATGSATLQQEWKAVRSMVDSGSVPLVDKQLDVPTIILTATRSSDDAEWIGRTPEGIVAWTELHETWASSLSNVVHIRTDRSGHYMQTEQPSLVVAAIEEACRAVVTRVQLSEERLQQIARGAQAEPPSR